MRNRFYSNATALLVTLLMVLGCGTVRPVPVQTTTNVQTVVRDSVRLKDSTIYVQVPVERYVDVVPLYDTLRLETELAHAEAYVDTLTHTLKGNLENRKEPIKTVIKYQDRKVEIRKDSIIVKEVPVEVEVVKTKVPRLCWTLLVFDVILLLAFGVFIYLKFFKPLP